MSTTDEATTHAEELETPKARENVVVHLLLHYPMVAVLGALLVVTSFLYPGFWTAVNLQNLLQQNVPLVMASIGMTLVILCGGFDLSVGSVYAAGAVFYLSFEGVLPAAVAVLLAILLGIGCGVVNGVLVNTFHINPFVATLGTSSAIIGGITLYAGANYQFSASPGYQFLGSAKLFGAVPLSGATGIVAFTVSALVLAKSTYGRAIYAVGGNREAARLSGIRVGVISASTFVIIGGLAALGGVFTASQLGTANPDIAGTMTLDSIAVVIIGGTSLIGGEGAMWRSAVGLGILAVINNLFSSLNFNPNLQLVFKGAIVIVAVGVDVWVRRRRSA
jgi:ribose/xylose/arabinose/galactoside ABC-type transport system permease subunit